MYATVLEHPMKPTVSAGRRGTYPRPYAYSIEQAFQLLGLTRTRGYKAIASGELETYKDGKRRMATPQACEKYVQAKQRASRRAGP
jgi:excisionase family DNA binding protein